MFSKSCYLLYPHYQYLKYVFQIDKDYYKKKINTISAILSRPIHCNVVSTNSADEGFGVTVEQYKIKSVGY